MYYLHVMNVNINRFNKPFAEFINENFCKENHHFLLVGTNENQNKFKQDIDNSITIKYPEGHTITNLIKYAVSLRVEIKKADIIIWHSLFYKRILFLYLVFSKSVQRKSNWIAWGGDLYNWKANTTGSLKNKMNILTNSAYKHFINNINSVLVVFPPDADVIRRNFGFMGVIRNITYIPDYDNSYLVDILKKTCNDDCCNIMIGHSAVIQMNHKQVLDSMYNIRKENIKIYIPLSYGSQEYAKEVQTYAEQLYGSASIVCINDYIPIKQYLELLARMDIAIYDTTRQIALGNIYILMAMNKIIYLQSGSVMYEYFKSIGLDVRDTKNIHSLTFEEFKMKTSSTKAAEYANKKYDILMLKEMWTNILELIVK